LYYVNIFLDFSEYFFFVTRTTPLRRFNLVDGLTWYSSLSSPPPFPNVVLFLYFIKLKKWKDEFLQWDPSSYSGISMIRVPFVNVWTPGFIETFYFNFNPKYNCLTLFHKILSFTIQATKTAGISGTHRVLSYCLFNFEINLSLFFNLF